MELKWEDPPGAGNRPVYDWRQIGSQLIGAGLGQWAVVATPKTRDNAGAIALNIRQANYDALKSLLREVGGRFEAVSRTVEGEHRVYARYTPPS